MGVLIASYNVNSIRARLPRVMEWLRTRSPDIVLLQETKVMDPQFPCDEIETLGYNIACFGQKTYNGVAVLSKFPIEDVTQGLPTFGSEQEARYIEVFTGGIRAASVYVPNGRELDAPHYQYKLNFFEALRTHSQQVLAYGEKFVLGGDFNVAPTDQDVHDPIKWHEQVLCSTPERQAFRGLLNLGFHDALGMLYPTTPPYTWWDYRNGSFPKNDGLRIDHMLTSPLATDALLEGGVDRAERGLEKASDHAPVWVRLS